MKIIERKYDKTIAKDIYKKMLAYKKMAKKYPDLTTPLIKNSRAALKILALRKNKLLYKGFCEEIEDTMSSKLEKKKYIDKNLKVLRASRKNIKSDIKSLDGLRYKTTGGVFDKSGTIKKLETDLAWNRIDSYRKPDDFGNHIAVEFEFFCPIRHMRDIQSVFVNAKLAKHVSVKWDGSIEPPYYTEDSCGECADCEEGYPEDCSNISSQHGYEIAVIAKEGDIDNVLKRVCDKLRQLDAKTNHTCGLHVHLDARNRNHKLMFHNLVSCQDLFFKMIPERRRTNMYCKPQNSPKWDDASYERYSAINKDAYSKHKTIEVRVYDGTIKYKEVSNWVKLLRRIASCNVKIPKVNSIPDMKKALKLDTDTTRYVREKIAECA